MTTATITSKGQVTIPADVRSRLGLRAGAKVDFVANADGEIVMRPRAGDMRTLRGLVTYRGPAVSIEDMDRAIAETAATSFARSLR